MGHQEVPSRNIIEKGKPAVYVWDNRWQRMPKHFGRSGMRVEGNDISVMSYTGYTVLQTLVR